MRTVDSPDHIIPALARLFLFGSLAGLALLTVFLLENVANLGYAVLAGGLWALLGLVGAFGLAFGAVAAALGLAMAALGAGVGADVGVGVGADVGAGAPRLRPQMNQSQSRNQ